MSIAKTFAALMFYTSASCPAGQQGPRQHARAQQKTYAHAESQGNAPTEHRAKDANITK